MTCGAESLLINVNKMVEEEKDKAKMSGKNVLYSFVVKNLSFLKQVSNWFQVNYLYQVLELLNNWLQLWRWDDETFGKWRKVLDSYQNLSFCALKILSYGLLAILNSIVLKVRHETSETRQIWWMPLYRKRTIYVLCYK